MRCYPKTFYGKIDKIFPDNYLCYNPYFDSGFNFIIKHKE